LYRLITILLSIFIFAYLAIWLASSASQGGVPSGAIWGLLSLGIWWMIGNASREDQRRR